MDINDGILSLEVNSICAVCVELLDIKTAKTISESTYGFIGKSVISFKPYEVLESMSKFKYLPNGPQFVCEDCFHAIFKVLRFQQMCNKAEDFFKTHIEQQNILLNAKRLHTNKTSNTANIVQQVENASTRYEIGECVEQNMINEVGFLSDDTDIDNVDCTMSVKHDNDEYEDIVIEQEQITENVVVENNNIHPSNLNKEDCKFNQCRLCLKVFSTKRFLKCHQRTHMSTKSYQCDLCSKTYKEKRHFDRHLVKHGVWLYECNICHDGFSDKNSFISHMSNHPKEKCFKCSNCEARFSDKSVWMRHEKTHYL